MLEDLQSQNYEYLAFDTETNGVDKDSAIIGFSLCGGVEKAYYVVLAYWDPIQTKLIFLETKDFAQDFFEYLKSFKLIMQNAPFDCARVMDNYGVDLMPPVFHDTMIGGHILNENRHNGLKERGVELYGEDERKEQITMRESVHRNGGVLTKKQYELFKADVDLIAHYGAKDAILTIKIFFNDVLHLFEERLDSFFYDDESMPLLKGPTYEMNTTGLRVDPEKLKTLKRSLEAQCLEDKAFIQNEIREYVKDKYPGTGKTNHFNIGANQQRAWLLYDRLGNDFHRLTKSGKELCKAMDIRVPYNNSDKRRFIAMCEENLGHIWCDKQYNYKTKKWSKPKKVEPAWKYMTTGKEALGKLQDKYKWVKVLLEYSKNLKLLNTYVEGIESRMRFNIIQPSFLQHGTTSGRYSCKHPNFQNLPRDDKRIKECIISRPGKVFVGADYEQLEPRVFASISGDETLMASFAKGEDFYSIVGAPIFGIENVSMFKNDPNSFAKKYPKLRDKAKIIALATPYGRTARQQAETMNITEEESQALIDKYFEHYPKVELMMLVSHEEAKRDGVVYNLFGRPRRIPEAKNIVEIYGNSCHSQLPYAARTLLNLAMNHKVQSTGASIMNRAAIAFWRRCKALAKQDPRWLEVKIVLQVHDELVAEAPEALGDDVVVELKDAMENTTKLPGVALKAEPKKAYNLADLK